MQKRWIARWHTKNGTPQELIFYSVESRGIARLDFQLKLIDRHVPVPDEFTLDDETLLIPPGPHLLVLLRQKR